MTIISKSVLYNEVCYKGTTALYLQLQKKTLDALMGQCLL